jgi:hypothetical protein
LQVCRDSSKGRARSRRTLRENGRYNQELWPIHNWNSACSARKGALQNQDGSLWRLSNPADRSYAAQPSIISNHA